MRYKAFSRSRLDKTYIYGSFSIDLFLPFRRKREKNFEQKMFCKKNNDFHMKKFDSQSLNSELCKGLSLSHIAFNVLLKKLYFLSNKNQ